MGAVVVLAAGAVGLYLKTHPRAPEAPPVEGPALASADDPLQSGPELRPLAERLRAESNPSARLRQVTDALRARQRARLAEPDEPTPAPRSPTELWRALQEPSAAVTELDLCRLAVTLLREAGSAEAQVVERQAPSRRGEPVDPSGARGSFLVALGDHATDVALATLVARSEAPGEALTARALSAAVRVQAALAASARGDRQEAVAHASSAVEAWPTSPTPLAARARVWLEVGGSGGLSLADGDLRAAVALRDDASYHLARARLALRDDRLGEAALEASRARRLAPGWGSAALAVLALGPVLAHLDAGVSDGCQGLRDARAPWTDDAYALCAEGVPEDVRLASARRLLGSARDPLVLAAAAVHGATGLSGRVGARDRPETAAWLRAFGRPDLAAGLLGLLDAGAL